MSWTASDARARYRRLKSERKCIRCAAGLQETDGVQCVECADEHLARQLATWRRAR